MNTTIEKIKEVNVPDTVMMKSIPTDYIEDVELALFTTPDSIKEVNNELPIVETLKDGVYTRTLLMPKGYLIIGMKHRDASFNHMHTGRLYLIEEDKEDKELIAPYAYVSPAGLRKVLYILEDTIWTNIMFTDLKTIEEARDYNYIKSPIQIEAEEIIKQGGLPI